MGTTRALNDRRAFVQELHRTRCDNVHEDEPGQGGNAGKYCTATSKVVFHQGLFRGHDRVCTMGCPSWYASKVSVIPITLTSSANAREEDSSAGMNWNEVAIGVLDV